MTGTENPMPSDSWAKLAGLSELNSPLSSSPNTAHLAEAVSLGTLYGMLTQVLERTTVLWKAQALTNQTLDELRKSIPTLHRNAGIRECSVCHVETREESLAHSQHVDLDLPPTSQYQVNSAQGTRGLPTILPPGEVPSLLGCVTMCDDKVETPVIRAGIPLSTHNDSLTPDATASSEKMEMFIGKSGSAPTSTFSLSPPTPGGNNSNPTPQDPLEGPSQKPPSPRLSFAVVNLPGVGIAERNEPLHNQPDPQTGPQTGQSLDFLDESTNMFRHTSSVCAIEKVLIEQQSMFKEDIVSAVRAAALEQTPSNIQSYLDEFSKSLSTEVRMLLGEVGKLREERRCIQHELGYLMMMQSALCSGEYDGDGLPGYSSPAALPSPAQIPLPESPLLPRSAWRILPKVDVPLPPPKAPVQLRCEPSWTTWQPNPGLVPTPPPAEHSTLLVPNLESPGLFGPRSPRDSPHELHRPPLPRQHSWATWLPNPALVPTPPSLSSTLLVPDRGSPELFGPRSPRSDPW